MPQSMPQKISSLTVTYNGISNILSSKASIGVAFDPNKTSPPSLTKFDAIWDTGASGSVITLNVINQCALKPISKVRVNTASGPNVSNVYLVSLQLPNGVGFPSLRVTEGQLVGTDILIGMDVIGQGDFSVSNFQGKTVFTYRIPSLTTTDYVEELEQSKKASVPEVGRNAPCPCGSRKKYKRCCGKS